MENYPISTAQHVNSQVDSAARALLADVARGPGALMISGEPGIGKTTSWRSVVDLARAQGFRVLVARPAQTESVLPFASLADLMIDIDSGEWRELAEPQRRAIDRALLRIADPGDAIDRRAVSAGFLSIINGLASTAPVLVAIDDLQWLDAPTRHVLEFAARRFSSRVRLVCAVRDPASDAGGDWLFTIGPDAVTRIRLSTLDPTDMHRVLENRFGRAFSLPTVARIHRISAGNPFYAIELARMLDGGVGDGRALPDTLAEVVARRIRNIAPEGREVLFVAACVADPTMEIVARTLRVGAGEIENRIETLEAEGILDVDGPRLRFGHPLLAHGVYTDASPSRRRVMHRRLAEVVEQPELRARHLALAATIGDARTVAALDEAADTARRRGAPDAAAELVGLAIRLGGDTADRRIMLAHDHFNAGDIARARDLLDNLLARTGPGPSSAAASGLLAVVRMFDDSFTEAVGLLERALVDAPAQSPVRVSLLIAEAFALANSERVAEGVDSADSAARLAHQMHLCDLEAQALGIRTILRFMLGDGFDADSLRRAVDLDGRPPGIPIAFRPEAHSALLAAWTGDLDTARERLELVRARCAAHGEEIELAFIAFHAAIIAIWRGDLPGATREADLMAERSRQLGGEMPAFVALTLRAMADAQLGDAGRARRDCLAALAVGRRWGSSTLVNWPRTILGFLDLSQDRFVDALDTLAPLIETVRAAPRAVEIITASFVPDAVEAMIRLGRVDEAEELIEILLAAGARHDRAWTLAVGSRCRAALLAARGDLVGAVAAGERALAFHARLTMPFELARTRLVVGEVHRRARRKDTAAGLLTEALSAFEALHTPLWAATARRALDRVGVGPRVPGPLTPSEQRVAELAASGMINRDIAATLFISPKTVEANLGKVYRKLGIRSRAELGARIGSTH